MKDLATAPRAVKRLPDGKIGIDTGRVALLNTSAVSAEQRKIDELRRKLEQYSGPSRVKAPARRRYPQRGLASSGPAPTP